MRAPSLLLVAVAAIACDTTVGPGPVRLNTPFQLAVGQRVVTGGVSVRFTGVPSDSRCARTVVCVWQGDGAVLVEIATVAAGARQDTLHTALDPRTIDVGTRTLELVELDPYPATTDPIPAGDYRATFVLR